MAAYYILLVLTYNDIQIIASQIIEILLLCIREILHQTFSKWVSAEPFNFVALLKDEDLRTLIFFCYISHILAILLEEIKEMYHAV